MDKHAVISALERAWANEARWNGITRPYNAGDVYRLRGSMDIEYSLARYGAARLWELLRDGGYVAVLSAVTGHQAVPQCEAALQAIYVSGWRAFRRSARVGEEVRPSGPQGARSHERVRHQAGRGAPRGGRVRCGHDPDRPHGREQRHAAHQRLGRVRSPLPDGGADRRRLLPGARRRGRRHRPGPGLRALRRPAVVRDVEAGSRGGDHVCSSIPRELYALALGVL